MQIAVIPTPIPLTSSNADKGVGWNLRIAIPVGKNYVIGMYITPVCYLLILLPEQCYRFKLRTQFLVHWEQENISRKTRDIRLAQSAVMHNRLSLSGPWQDSPPWRGPSHERARVCTPWPHVWLHGVQFPQTVQVPSRGHGLELQESLSWARKPRTCSTFKHRKSSSTCMNTWLSAGWVYIRRHYSWVCSTYLW